MIPTTTRFSAATITATGECCFRGWEYALVARDSQEIPSSPLWTPPGFGATFYWLGADLCEAQYEPPQREIEPTIVPWADNEEKIKFLARYGEIRPVRLRVFADPEIPETITVGWTPLGNPLYATRRLHGSLTHYYRLEPVGEEGGSEPGPVYAHLKLSHHPNAFVNVMLLDRAYGGPEEGGWWYNTAEPQSAHHHETIEEAVAFAIQLGGAGITNIGRPPISNVNSIGEFAFEINPYRASHRPSRRPHYE